MDNWKDMLEDAFSITGDDFKKMESTLSNDELTTFFDAGVGSPNGSIFTAWGDKYVYFPVCYDGYESVGYAPRNPCEESTTHQGGW